MSKTCFHCKKELVWPDINSCYYCQKNYCGEHRLAENHECPKVMAAKYIEKDYIQKKKGVNITTAKFAVTCKNCGFTSDYSNIEDVNQIRILHIHQNHCPSDKVQLHQHEENKNADDEFIRKTYPTKQGNTWMYGCLEEAKKILKQHHTSEGILELFEAKFSISIQTDKEYAYGYIDGTHPFYRIGIHKALENNSSESYKMVTVILTHELLHALHHDWSESQVSNEEKRLVNLGLHFDALQNLDIFYLSGKMRLCDK